MRRIDQLLANLGYCSRSEARTWVKAGRVRIGGIAAEDPGEKADPALVTVDGAALDHPDGLLLLYHKPVGLTCSHDPSEAPLIYDGLPDRWKRRNPALTSVGRLDKETSGLLLLTDQTALVHRLTSPKKELPKVYEVVLDRDVTPEMVTCFQSGMLVLDGETKPCLPAVLQPLDGRRAHITLTEGKYHQVRRMFAACGATVLGLHRSHFGPLQLGDLRLGYWKELSLNSL